MPRARDSPPLPLHPRSAPSGLPNAPARRVRCERAPQVPGARLGYGARAHGTALGLPGWAPVAAQKSSSEPVARATHTFLHAYGPEAARPEPRSVRACVQLDPLRAGLTVQYGKVFPDILFNRVGPGRRPSRTVTPASSRPRKAPRASSAWRGGAVMPRAASAASTPDRPAFEGWFTWLPLPWKPPAAEGTVPEKPSSEPPRRHLPVAPNPHLRRCGALPAGVSDLGRTPGPGTSAVGQPNGYVNCVPWRRCRGCRRPTRR